MSYPQTSDFTSPVPGSAYWRVSVGPRQYLIKWDGWSFVAMLRMILLEYLTTPVVENSQLALGARTPMEAQQSYALQIVAAHFLNPYRAAADTAEIPVRVDVADDWDHLAVYPWQVGQNAPATFTPDMLRGVYALLERYYQERSIQQLRMLLALPEGAPATIQRAMTTPITPAVMQILATIVTGRLMAPIQPVGALTVDMPRDVTPLVLYQEPRRPATATSPDLASGWSAWNEIRGTTPEIIDLATMQPARGSAGSRAGMSTGSKVAIGLGVAAVVGAGWWWLRTPPKPRGNPLAAADFPDRETRPLVREAINQGWTLERGGSHFKLRSPQGQTIILAGSPSDWRAGRNARAQLRRAGLVL